VYYVGWFSFCYICFIGT